MKDAAGMTKRDTAVLKGAAVLMMVFHHCFRTKSIFSGYAISFAPLSRALVVDLCAAFKICVPIFAFISGYGLTLGLKKLHEDCCLNRRELERWYVLRYIRLMAGYWFIYVCYAVIGQLAGHHFTAAYFGDGRLKGIMQALFDFLGLSNLMGTPILGGAWWYMSCAIVIVLLVPLFARLTVRFGGVSVLAGLFILPRALCLEYPMYDCAYHFLFAALLGVVFAEYDLFGRLKAFRLCKHRGADTILQGAGLLIMIALLYRLSQVLDVATIWEVKHGLFPLAVILFVVKFISPVPVVSHVLAFLGRYSMDIFLVHLLIRAHFKAQIFSLGHFVLVGGVLLLVSLALAIVIEWVKARIHYQKAMDALAKRVCKALGLD